ncbi:Proton/sodium-glutamate symport protein [Enhygromyxa salina]|uniref:Proton/sodium-glutamate symport protein n=1 Tax=Enhygromyxa salina TaxID=215803 RepID=A0A2S9XIB3_9BACT|nr:dicarboxylate/amino acid:cation symporter [Enhygromyxa salina]PRP92619.1 Proton/sodium-glutamate symport protein [Enhygromyxa salina]
MSEVLEDPPGEPSGDADDPRRGSNLLLIGILAGVALGAVAGGQWPQFGRGVEFLGEVFLHALMLMVVPLVVCSMVMGVAAFGDVRKLGGIGLETLVYYTITTALAVLVGLVAVNLTRPGEGVTIGESVAASWRIEDDTLVIEGGAKLEKIDYDHKYRVVVQGRAKPDAEVETYHGRIPEYAAVTETELPIQHWELADGTSVAPPVSGEPGLQLELARAPVQDKTILEVVREVVVGLVPKNLIMAAAETQVLPVILFALALGAVLTTLGERGGHVILFFDGLNEAIMIMVRGIMYFAPIGIFALVAGRLGRAGGFEGFLPQLRQIAWYAGTVIGALGFHALIVLPALLLFVGKKNPIAYASGMVTALMTAFSTASSAATLPLTLRGVAKNGVRARAASFVCPLGTTINMDGTAMYEAVAAMFIAQAYGIELTIAHQVIIFLTATLAAIGAAGIPEAGLVTMVIVLNAVNLPTDGIVLILAIDWFLDRCRTTVNVWGDSIGAAVIDQLEGSPDPPELPAGAT